MIMITHLIDDSGAQGDDKENCSVGEDNSNMSRVLAKRKNRCSCMLE